MKQCRGQMSMFSAEAFLDPASRSVLPGSEKARKMTVTSGLKCCELYKNSGPLGLLVRMLLESSIWHSTRCFLTWKTSATPARRLLFRLVPSTPRTGEIDAPLLPMITKFDADCGDLKGKEYTGTRHAMKLIQAAKMWPTPRANDAEKRGAISMDKRNGLPAAVLFPTPKASDSKGSGPAGSKSAEHDFKKKNLKGTVMYLDHVNGGQLNPDWVEWLMAFPPGWTDIG